MICPAPDASDELPRLKPSGPHTVDDLVEVGLMLLNAITVQNQRLGELVDLVLAQMHSPETDEAPDETPTVGLDGQPIPRR